MSSNILSIIYSLLFIALSGCGNAQLNESKEMKLKVYHYKVPCVGEGIQLCLFVSKNGGDPEYFYDEIEGFDYKWGYSYEISVEQKKKNNPPPGASSFSYLLKRVIKKNKVQADETFELPVTLDDNILIETKDDKCQYAGSLSIKTDKITCASLLSAKIGVFRHSENGIELVGIK